MRKKLLKEVVIGLAVALVTISAFLGAIMFIPDEDGEYLWNPFDYAKITEVDYRAVVAPEGDGRIIVTERLTFDVHAMSNSNLYWELYRDLCEDYVDGLKVDYKVNYVKRISKGDEPDFYYEQSPKLYWFDSDYTSHPHRWFHSPGPYNERLRQYECVLFYVEGIYRDTIIFEVGYEMRNAALRYGDSSELYITLFSEKDVKNLKSFKAEILFPNNMMPEDGNYFAATLGTNSQSFPFEESSSRNPGYNTFSFELDQKQLKFRPYNQYIEFALVSYGDDKYAFTQNAPTNTHSNSDVLEKEMGELEKYDALAKKFRTIKIAAFAALSLGAFLVVKFAFSKNEQIKKRYILYSPAIEMEYFRDIPSELDPVFATKLVFCKHRAPNDIQNDYAAIVLSLMHKQYIEFEKQYGDSWLADNVRITVKHSPLPDEPKDGENSAAQIHGLGEEGNQAEGIELLDDVSTNPNLLFAGKKKLTPTEELYLNLILRHATIGKNGLMQIPLETFQQKITDDYEHTHSFVTNVQNTLTAIGVSDGYFQKAQINQPREEIAWLASLLGVIGSLVILVGNLASRLSRLDLAFGGFWILGASMITSAVILYKEHSKFVLLTQFGEDEYAKWLGLYNFLSSETLMNERTVVELPIWESYLIYATAFGISDKVIEALKIRCPNPEDSPILRNSSYPRSSGFRSSHSSFRSSVRSASASSRSGGSGGYGGGGRGGGGGGGGH
ncbi:MAG: DUF2207 domain-containing protein [Eubacteriaceae bacterium]|nr:DUF2207 domain-containing protein [Eubacteriaceae bacterium]